jgi:thioester reductase-like protein
MGPIFITGATGYLGSYVVSELLREGEQRLALLVRAGSQEEARKRLWRALQLHLGFAEFIELLDARVDLYLGDITRPGLGLERDDFERLARSIDSIIHIAASLNRRSAKACFNVNLRGTLEVVKLGRAAADDHGLRRFSDVSTTAVAGRRDSETVREESAVEWDRSDYDPYARTKKFCEHMLRQLLPDVPLSVFRPSIVLGDSRFPQTTQFDMVWAFAALARMPVLPFDSRWRADIVPSDYVGRAIAAIHQKPHPAYDIYHLSSGSASLSYGEMTDALEAQGLRIPHLYLPSLKRPFTTLTTALAGTPRSWGLALPASLLDVFAPYLFFNTVFDNERVKQELGEAPAPFTDYAYGLLRFALDNGFRYPYQPWPEAAREGEGKWRSA